MKRTQQTRGGVMPFIDLLFILLFSLLAMSETRKSASQEPVRIHLPEVEPGGNDDAADARATVVLEIDNDSTIRVQGIDEIVDSPEELDALIDRQLEGRHPEECEVEIRGDTKADHGVSVAVLQHLRNRGFAGVALLATGADTTVWGEAEQR
ncbi:MAG: ExbD/TolR family protein [Planctomycetota bacterium]|jgi:biopolymer transport protein ExbD